MGKLDVLRPYVEQVLREYLEVDELVVDPDGDIPVRRDSTMYWVTLFERNGEAQLRVWSYMARKIQPTAALYEHLNGLNARISYGRVFWSEGDVYVAYELLADGLDARELTNACDCVGSISDHFDDEVVELFGGEVFFAGDEAAGPGDADPGDAVEI